MIRLGLLLACVSILSCASGQSAAKKQVLGVFAHYDDETLVSALLSKYASKGYTLYAMYLTAGEGGRNRHDYRMGPEALKTLRRAEMEKAASVLGFERWWQFNFPDIPLRIPEKGYPHPQGRPSRNGVDFLNTGIWDVLKIKKRILDTMEEHGLNPDVVITLTPEHGVVHAHHQAAAMIVKQLFIDEGEGGPRKIYFALEPQWYEKHRSAKADYILPIAPYASKVMRVYQAHYSQGVSKKSRGELEGLHERYRVWVAPE